MQFPEERVHAFEDYERSEEACGFFKKPEKVYEEGMLNGLYERRSILYSKVRGKANYFSNLRNNGVLVKATGEILAPQRPLTRSFASSIFKATGTRRRKRRNSRRRKRIKRKSVS